MLRAMADGATNADDHPARRVQSRMMRATRRAAEALAHEGARAVVLTGSYARGDAHAASDIDLIALGRGRALDVRQPGRHLIVVAWTTAAAVRRAFRSPALAPAQVPGWRDAVILHDPHGDAARLQRLALAWGWGPLSDSADLWVAEEIAGLAEEVRKLAAAPRPEQRLSSEIWRSVLALRLASVMSVHCRMLSPSENLLWDAVAARMGARWTRAQVVALGMRGAPAEGRREAALELYAMALEACASVMSAEQRRIARTALAAARSRARGRAS